MDSRPLLLASVGAGTALLTWLLVGQLIRLAPRIGLLDRPNARSSHTRVTPRGGGIGFVVAITLAIALWAALGDGRQMDVGWRMMDGKGQMADDGGRKEPAVADPCAPCVSRPTTAAVVAPHQLLAILLSALFIAAISLRDDFKSLGAGLRFVCHFAAAGTVVWAVGAFTDVEVPFGGVVSLLGWAGLALTLLWIVGLTNVYNFMDGIDGIAGVQGVVAGLGWWLAGRVFDAPATACLGAALAGGCAGFLVHNWSPAKIFMGDVGSAFLGFLFAAVPLVAVREAPDVAGSWPVFGGLVVWPFVGDGVLTFVRRLAKREKVWQAHRSHLYQRLTQSGWKHAPVSRLYAGWAGVSFAAAWLWVCEAPGAAWAAWLVPLVTLGGLFAFVSNRERRAARGA